MKVVLPLTGTEVVGAAMTENSLALVPSKVMSEIVRPLCRDSSREDKISSAADQDAAEALRTTVSEDRARKLFHADVGRAAGGEIDVIGVLRT